MSVKKENTDAVRASVDERVSLNQVKASVDESITDAVKTFIDKKNHIIAAERGNHVA